MANNLVVLSITTPQTIGGYSVDTNVTTGSYDLRVTPFSSTGIAGTHLASGKWVFTGLSDTAEYKLYDTAGGTEVTSFTGGGSNTRAFFDTALQTYIRKDGTVAFTGAQSMGGFKLTGLAAATANGEACRWEQTGVINQARGISGVWSFSAVPLIEDGNGDPILPTDSGHAVCKLYVDSVLGSATGMVQDEYTVKCIPNYTGSSRFAKTTILECRAYLATLTNITSYRGLIILETSQTTNHNFLVDSDDHVWISNGIDIIGFNKPRITRASYQDSLTSDSRITNCHIYDTISSPVTRAYTNFTFKDCDFTFSGKTATFTTCVFLGDNRIRMNGSALTLANCYGTGKVTTEASPTISGTKQPLDVTTGVSTDVLGL